MPGKKVAFVQDVQRILRAAPGTKKTDPEKKKTSKAGAAPPRKAGGFKKPRPDTPAVVKRGPKRHIAVKSAADMARLKAHRQPFVLLIHRTGCFYCKQLSGDWQRMANKVVTDGKCDVIDIESSTLDAHGDIVRDLDRMIRPNMQGVPHITYVIPNANARTGYDTYDYNKNDRTFRSLLEFVNDFSGTRGNRAG